MAKSDSILSILRSGIPKEASLVQLLAQEAKKPKEPTEAQAEAGNYQKGHVNIHGLRITIEKGKGRVRSGVDSKGREWSNKLNNHYGYIRGVRGRDKDNIDVFIGPNPTCELVYIVDQVDPTTKKFDEHKCMLGFDTAKAAKSAYLSNYGDGWKGLGDITPLTLPQFKSWIADGDKTRPMTKQTFWIKTSADSEDEDDDESERPPVVIIRKSLQIRMIIPDRLPPRDEEGRFISPEDAEKAEKKAAAPGSQDIAQLLWSLVASPAITQYLQKANPGMVIGPFNPTGSIVDYLDDQKFQAMHTEIARLAATNDPALRAVILGAFRKAGIEGTSLAGVQPEKIQEIFGLLAPVLMEHSPELFDQIHGSAGSRALLESSLAKAFRYTPDMTPNMLKSKVQEVSDNLMGSIGKQYALSGHELGQFFQNASQHGLVSPTMSTQAMMAALQKPAGLLAATRDVLGAQGITDFSSQLQAANAAAEAAGYDYERAERDLRMGSFMQQGGGMFGRALGMSGQQIQGGSLESMNAMNQKLISQGLGSRVGNMVSAAARAVGEGIAKPGSKLHKFVNDAKRGILKPFTSGEWQRMMVQSGVPLSTASSLLRQPAENMRYVSQHPAFQTVSLAIRMNQAAFDHGPAIAEIEKRYANHPHKETMIRGAMAEKVRGWGYDNLDQYKQLHGPAVKQLLPLHRKAQEYAAARRGAIGVGSGTPLERIFDFIKSDDNTAAGAVQSGFNVIDPALLSRKVKAPATPATPAAVPKPATVSAVPAPRAPKAPGIPEQQWV